MVAQSYTFSVILEADDEAGELLVVPWPCWCWQCSDVSLAEYIPSPAEIINEAKAWRQRQEGRQYRVAFGPLGLPDDDDAYEPKALEYYDAVLIWRQKRKSPGRCLFCGSTMV